MRAPDQVMREPFSPSILAETSRQKPKGEDVSFPSKARRNLSDTAGQVKITETACVNF